MLTRRRTETTGEKPAEALTVHRKPWTRNRKPGEFDVSFRSARLGINIRQTKNNGGQTSRQGHGVIDVLEVQSPDARRLGVKALDEVLAVAGESVVGMKLRDLQSLLASAPRPVVVKFRRPGAKQAADATGAATGGTGAAPSFAAARAEAARKAAGYVGPAEPANKSIKSHAFDRAVAWLNDTKAGPEEEKTYPLLAHLGVPLGSNWKGKDCRSTLMSELVQYNINHKEKIEYMPGGGKRVRLLKLPGTPRRLPERNLDEHFIVTCKRTGFMNELVDGLVKYRGDNSTEEEAEEMLLHYFAKKRPQSYMKHADVAKELAAKQKKRKEPVVLPPGFQYFDGSPSPEWNIKYMELRKYKEEHGDCLVRYGKDRNPLGSWVSTQRANYRKKNPSLTPKRIELLESLGFVWSTQRPDTPRALYGDKGDPRFNLAMAARMHYPNLTIRESLLLGGYDEDQMDDVVDEKHTWRTYFVTLKDQMNKKVKKWDELKGPAKAEMNRLIGILKDNPVDGAAEVFGDKAALLPKFAEAAVVRREQGIDGKECSSRRKRPAPTQHPEISDDEEQLYDDESVDEHFWTKKSRTSQEYSM